MKSLSHTLLLVLLLPIVLLQSSSVFASHSFGGMDMCALYPEVMPPGLMSDQLPDAGGQGAMLMESYCTQCHAMPGPGRHTAEEWPQVLDHMLMLMDVADRFGGLLGNVKTPSSAERDQMRSYLVLHALKPMPQKPKGIGASSFENHCSACHALPDPAHYNDVGWPSLIKRMQHNMQVMKYDPPSVDSMMQIQLYLQNNKSRVDINPVSAGDYLSLNMSGDSVSFKSRNLGVGSWLSLGLFLLLAFIGLVRWWRSHHDANCLTSIKQTKV
jgi:cytochrome c5